MKKEELLEAVLQNDMVLQYASKKLQREMGYQVLTIKEN